MERYARGEDGVFELLYKLAAPRLYRFCLRLTATRSEADDLLQDTFLRLHRARATYMRGANVLHWAFAIARSAYLDRLRYWRRRPEDLGASNDASENERLHADARYSPEAEARAHEAAEIVKRELSKLSEKNRVAYILLREEGLSVKEAAALLGATADVVKQRAHRAHEHLRNALAAAGWTEYSSDASASSADAEYIGRSALADVGDSSW
jgi:RNA polymerase sigma-70 factor, ECF subfamily